MKQIVKSRLVWGVLGFVAGMFVTNLGVVLTVRNVIVREYRSPLDFAATVETIQTNASGHGWRVYKPQEPPVVQVAGDRKLGPVQVLELSHPAYTAEALRNGRNRCVAMTPYTITVYEENGKVYVAFVNNGVIGRFFRQQARVPMTKVRGDEKEILAFLTQN